MPMTPGEGRYGMAAGYDGSIRIDSKINTAGFDQGVKSISQGVGAVTGSLKKLAGAVGVAFGIGALVRFGKQAIDTASDLAEVQNVVDTAFGDMAYKAEDFAGRAIEQFGMSALAAKKTSSTFMAMSKSMGLGAGAASDMAISVAGLTGDVASFYNISQDLAAVKLKAIWTGETEGLKDLGVVMTQTNLQAFALQQGITKSLEKMSQAELVTLRYKYVTEQLGLAQGDFAKTSGSWANQTRILSERFNELLGILGNGLIAALTPALQYINAVMASLLSFAKTVSAVLSSLFGTQEQVQKGAVVAVENTTQATDELGASTAKAGKEAQKSKAGFDNLNTLSDGAQSSGSGSAGGAGMEIPALDGAMPKDLDTSGIESAVDRITSKFKEMADKVKEYYGANLSGSVNGAMARISESAAQLLPTFQKVWDDIANLGEPLKSWFSGSFTTFLQTFIATSGKIVSGLLDTFNKVFSDIWDIVISPTLQKWAVDILPLLTNIGTESLSTLGVLFDNVKMLFDTLWSEGIAPALALIQQIWSDMWDGIIAAWEEHGKPIFEGIRELINNVADTLKNIWDTILKPIWDKLIEVLTELWSEHLKPLWDNILDLIGSIAEFLLAWWNNVLLPIVNWFITVFGPNIAAGFNQVLQVVGTVVGGIADFVNAIITSLKGWIDFLTGVFTGDWEKAWQGIVDVFKGLFDGIVAIVKTVVNIVIDTVNGMINAVTSGINTVIRALNTLSFDVPDWIPGIGGKTWGFSIPLVVAPQIPHLATGAVIPPNSEFLAVLGDQKNGRNLEGPEGLFRQIVREEMAPIMAIMARTSQTPNLSLHLEGSMAELARVLRPYLEADGKRTGVKLVKGGT